MRSPPSFGGIAAPRRVGLVSVAHGINEFYAIVLPPLFPFLVSDLSISYAEAGTLLTVFYAMYAALQIPAGMLADRVGKFRLVVGGLLVLGGGVLLMSLAPDYRTLLAAQVVAGAGGSTYHPAGMSLVSDLETGGTEGRAMGIHGAVGTAGVAAAPALLGALTTVVDWRTALAVAGGAGLVAVALLWIAYEASGGTPEADDPDGGGRVDDHTSGRPDDHTSESAPPASGSAGASDRDASDGSATSGGRDDGSAASGGTARLRDRLRAAVSVPVTDYLLVLLAAHALVAMLTRAVQTYTTSFVFAGGTSATGANAAFVALLLGSGVASLSAGDLADRLDRTRLGIGVSVVTAGLLGATSLLPEGLPYAAVLGWFFVLGVATYAVAPVKNAISAGYTERETSGSVFGLLMTASAVGGTASPALFGLLAARYGLAVAYPAIGGVCALLAVCLGALALTGDPTTLWDPRPDGDAEGERPEPTAGEET